MGIGTNKSNIEWITNLENFKAHNLGIRFCKCPMPNLQYLTKGDRTSSILMRV